MSFYCNWREVVEQFPTSGLKIIGGNQGTKLSETIRPHRCEWCGKKFEAHTMYTIKKKLQSGKTLWFCTDGCRRAWEKVRIDELDATIKECTEMLELIDRERYLPLEERTIKTRRLSHIIIKYENKLDAAYRKRAEL